MESGPDHDRMGARALGLSSREEEGADHGQGRHTKDGADCRPADSLGYVTESSTLHNVQQYYNVIWLFKACDNNSSRAGGLLPEN